MKKKTTKRTTTKKVQDIEEEEFKMPVAEIAHEVDDDDREDDGLTTKQRSFVAAITGPAAGNATKAAKMAGYRDDNYMSLAVTASDTLKLPNVQEAIALTFARKRMTPEWAQERLMEIASASMRNFVSVDDQGKLTVDWKKAAEHGAVGQIREIREKVVEHGEKVEIIDRSFKLHDVVNALRTVLRLSGHLKDEKTIRLTGADGGAVKAETKMVFTDDQLRDAYQQFVPRNGKRTVTANDN